MGIDSLRFNRGLAVSLVSGEDLTESGRIAELLSGMPASSEPEDFDRPDLDSAEFALDLGESLAAASRQGSTGHTVVALEAHADTVEIALVLEHVLDSQQPAVAVSIRDVVAVTSVQEIMTTLFLTGADAATTTHPDDVGLPGRLARRLEFASVIVLTDLRSGRPSMTTSLVTSFLARLAPAASVLSDRDLASLRLNSEVLVRGRAHRLGSSMGWQRLLRGATADTAEGIGTYVFRDPRPFHPARLHRAISSDLTCDRVGRILRSRGFVRLATRSDRVGSWSTAGDVLDLDPTNMLSWHPDSPIGQEIAFVGRDLDRDALALTLSECLLSSSELAAGPSQWAGWVDPFPDWALHHHR